MLPQLVPWSFVLGIDGAADASGSSNKDQSMMTLHQIVMVFVHSHLTKYLPEHWCLACELIWQLRVLTWSLNHTRSTYRDAGLFPLSGKIWLRFAAVFPQEQAKQAFRAQSRPGYLI